MTASGVAVRIARRSALDNPWVMGTCKTRRSVHHPRVIIPIASSALPIAPAVVPSCPAPTATAVKSRIVAARLIPRMGFVFPIACNVVMRRRLWAEKIIVTASIAKGTAPAASEGP